jgi:hypothetical protein
MGPNREYDLVFNVVLHFVSTGYDKGIVSLIRVEEK